MQKKILYILLFFVSLSVTAQNMTLYGLKFIPQSNQINPAFFPSNKIYIGVPVLSSINLGVSNSFSLADALETRNGSTQIDLDNLTRAFQNNGSFKFNTQLDILSAGYKIGDYHYITANFLEVIQLQVAYNNGLFNLAKYGTADSLTLGTNVTINNFGPKLMHYSKIGIGYTYEGKDKSSFGIRPNLYFGKGYVNTLNSEITLYTSSAIDRLSVNADVTVQSAGSTILSSVLQFDDSSPSFNVGQYALNFRNGGFGIDMGATTNVDETMTLSASLIDLGFIRWAKEPRTHLLKNVEVDFTGIDALALVGGNDQESEGDSSTAIDTIIASIVDQILIREDKNGYTTWLPTKLYLAGEWHIDEALDLMFLIKTEVIDGRLTQSLTTGGNVKVGKALNFGLTYSITNGTYDNIGFGMGVNIGPVQFYLISDNLYDLTQLDYARQMNLRFGFNFRPVGKNDEPIWSPRR